MAHKNPKSTSYPSKDLLLPGPPSETSQPPPPPPPPPAGPSSASSSSCVPLPRQPQLPLSFGMYRAPGSSSLWGTQQWHYVTGEHQAPPLPLCAVSPHRGVGRSSGWKLVRLAADTPGTGGREVVVAVWEWPEGSLSKALKFQFLGECWEVAAVETALPI
ncbi:hypothetical protein F4775DRAFT_539289 [Biscogniauxia sp. FL1348]|nr:hypothetical protein F4775DRAFT_539289 [Biscogniauxia sp. FL1348]